MGSSSFFKAPMILILGLGIQDQVLSQSHDPGGIQNPPTGQTAEQDLNNNVIPCTGTLCAKTDGNIYMYFCDGSDVRIRVCTEKKAVHQRKDCNGPEIKLPKTKFLEAVYAQISAANGSELEPLSEEDIQHSRLKPAENTSELEACVLKLRTKVKTLEEFIKWLDPDVASEDREELAGLKGELTTMNENFIACRIKNLNFDRATEKIKVHVDQLMENICDEKLHLVKPSSHSDTLLYTVLDRIDPGKFPCGQKGSTNERIAECKKLNQQFEKKTSKRGTFQLVSRNEAGAEAWMDARTGLVWHDVLNGFYKWDEAKMACANLGLRLPTAEEFEEAEKNGFREVVANTNNLFFWTSSPNLSGSRAEAIEFRAGEGELHPTREYYTHSVRCVGR